MRTQIKALILVGTIGLATVAFARPPHAQLSPEKMAEIAEQRLEKKLAVVDGLELDADKTRQLKEIITSHNGRKQTLTLEYHQQRQALQQEYQTNLESLLTEEEQKTLHSAMKKELKKYKKDKHHDNDHGDRH